MAVSIPSRLQCQIGLRSCIQNERWCSSINFHTSASSERIVDTDRVLGIGNWDSQWDIFALGIWKRSCTTVSSLSMTCLYYLPVWLCYLLIASDVNLWEPRWFTNCFYIIVFILLYTTVISLDGRLVIRRKRFNWSFHNCCKCERVKSWAVDLTNRLPVAWNRPWAVTVYRAPCHHYSANDSSKIYSKPTGYRMLMLSH